MIFGSACLFVSQALFPVIELVIAVTTRPPRNAVMSTRIIRTVHMRIMLWQGRIQRDEARQWVELQPKEECTHVCCWNVPQNCWGRHTHPASKLVEINKYSYLWALRSRSILNRLKRKLSVHQREIYQLHLWGNKALIEAKAYFSWMWSLRPSMSTLLMTTCRYASICSGTLWRVRRVIRCWRTKCLLQLLQIISSLALLVALRFWLHVILFVVH